MFTDVSSPALIRIQFCAKLVCDVSISHDFLCIRNNYYIKYFSSLLVLSLQHLINPLTSMVQKIGTIVKSLKAFSCLNLNNNIIMLILIICGDKFILYLPQNNNYNVIVSSMCNEWVMGIFRLQYVTDWTNQRELAHKAMKQGPHMEWKSSQKCVSEPEKG